jgi:very-short-patch-repair endonuclease
MHPDLSDFAAFHDGIFKREHALGFGLTRREVDKRLGNAWKPVYEGVYRVAGAPLTWRGQLRAACWSTSTLSAISHRAAGGWHELPGGRTDLVELTSIRWLRARETGIVVHESQRLDRRDITTIDGIPVTTPERTILDLASCFPYERYLEHVVQAARRKRLITYESMRAVFDRHARRGLKGVKALRSVLDGWDPRSAPTESEMETRLLLVVREHGLPEPVLQHTVNGYRVDAAYPSARLAIEYDSKQEHSDEFQLAKDARRRNALQVRGWVVLSARHADLSRGGSELCNQVETLLNLRRTTTGAVVS